MVDRRRRKRLPRASLVAAGGVLLLLATATFVSSALQNWPFTIASNYTFDPTKIEVSDDVAKLKPPVDPIIHDEQADFSGTHSDTQWVTDHIELNATGLSAGSGTYTSQTIDSGAQGTEWGVLSWTEALTQGSASFSSTKSVGALSGGKAVYGADVDGDDDVDVVAVQGTAPFVLYFENDGAENFTSRTIDSSLPNVPQDVHAADIN
ncbi:MAG: hypothetical protein ACE5K9_08235, partial [Candidatus Methylomirabilales bacterium]